MGEIVGRGTFITDNYNSLMVVRKSCKQELPRPAREVYISLKGSCFSSVKPACADFICQKGDHDYETERFFDGQRLQWTER